MMNKVTIEIKWSIIFFIATLLWMLLERLLGLHDQYIEKHAIYTNFFAVIAIGIYVLALLNKRKHYFGGQMSYVEGVRTGLIMTLIIVLLVPLTQYLTHNFITPDYFINVAEQAVSSGQLTEAEAKAYFSLSHYIKLSMIMAAVMGIVTSLIVAFFTRSRS